MSNTVIDATLRLIDMFSPTLQHINNGLDDMIGTVNRARDEFNTYGSTLNQQGRHIEQYARQNKRLARSLDRTGDKFISLGKKGAMAFAPMIGAMTYGIKQAADLDQQVAHISLLIDNATADTNRQIKSNILDISNMTGVYRGQVAEVVEELVSQDVALKDIKSVGEAIINTQRIGGGDLEQVSQTMLKLKTLYGMTDDQIGQIGDKMIKLKNVSTATVETMSLYMPQIASALTPLNMGLNQAGALFGAISDVAPTAEKADTWIRGVASGLMTLSDTQNNMLLDQGINVMQLLSNGQSLVDVVYTIHQHLKHMNVAEEQAYMLKVLGTQEGIQGYNAILKQMDKYHQNVDALKTSQGQLNHELAKLNQNDMVRFQQARNRLSNNWIVICTKLTPIIGVLADALGHIADIIGKLSERQLKLIGGIALSLAGMSAVTIATGFLFKGLGSVLFNITKMAVKMRENGGALGYFAAKAALVKKALNEIRIAGGYIEKIKFTRFVVQLGAFNVKARETINILSRFSGLRGWSVIKGVKKGILRGIGSGIWSSIVFGADHDVGRFFRGSEYRALLTALRSGLLGSFRGILIGLRMLAGGISMALSPMGIAIIAVCGAIYLLITHWKQVKASALPVIKLLGTTWNNCVKIVRPSLRLLIMAISNLIATFRALGKNRGVQQCLHYLKVFVMFLGGTLLTVILTVIGTAIGAFSGFATAVAHVISTAIAILAHLIAFVTDVFSGNWGAAWQDIVNIFATIFGGIRDIAHDVINGMIDTINGGLSAINGVVSAVSGGKATIPQIPHFASGADSFSGGLAQINEEGGEIVNLPSHTQVIPHDESLRMEYSRGQAAGSITIAKLADSIIVRQESDIDKIAEALVNKISATSCNKIVGAY